LDQGKRTLTRLQETAQNIFRKFWVQKEAGDPIVGASIPPIAEMALCWPLLPNYLDRAPHQPQEMSIVDTLPSCIIARSIKKTNGCSSFFLEFSPAFFEILDFLLTPAYCMRICDFCAAIETTTARKGNDVTIQSEKLKSRLLADPKIKAEYDALAPEFEIAAELLMARPRALRRSNPLFLFVARWIASRSLSSGDALRRPLARNDEFGRSPESR
jgi:hypothetical protein